MDNSKELAQCIVDEIENMIPRLNMEEFAPVSEVEKWLIATDNTGDANEISKEIYKIFEQPSFLVNNKMNQTYRIQNENGTFHNAGTGLDSWFTIEAARSIVNYEIGQRIVFSDGMDLLMETF